MSPTCNTFTSYTSCKQYIITSYLSGVSCNPQQWPGGLWVRCWTSFERSHAPDHPHSACLSLPITSDKDICAVSVV